MLCAVIGGIITPAAKAADNEDRGTSPMWGIRAAIDFNLPGKWRGDAGSVKMYGNGYGFTIGAVYNVFLGRGFYLEPGVSFFYDSYRYDDLVITNDSGEAIKNDPSLYKAGIRVPVLVGYAFDITDRFSMTVYTGPELSYAFAGKVNLGDAEEDAEGALDLFGSNGTQRRVDCAWRIGVGFPISNFLLSIDGAIGMTDLLRSSMSFRENRVSVGLTYYF